MFDTYFQIPMSFVELQQMVIASVLKKDHLPLPYKAGINKSAMLKTWKILSKIIVTIDTYLFQTLIVYREPHKVHIYRHSI